MGVLVFQNYGLLRILVCCVAVLGIIGYAAGLFGYFCLNRRNLFGIDLVSPLTKLALTRFLSYQKQTKLEGYLKTFVDGAGIAASLLLLFGAWKRSRIPCFVYILYALVYLGAMSIYSGILIKMLMLGVKPTSMLKEIIPTALTASFLILGILNGVVLIVQSCRGTRGEEITSPNFDSSTKKSEIP